MVHTPVATHPSSHIDPTLVSGRYAGSTSASPRRRGRRRRGRAERLHAQNREENPASSQVPSVQSRHNSFNLSQPIRLNGNAPVFTPASVAPASIGHQSYHAPRARRTPRRGQQRPNQPERDTLSAPTTQATQKSKQINVPPRSVAQDVASRVHEDITNGLYECAICTNPVSRHSPVWSCHACWIVLHLGCVKRWSKNESSAAAQPQPEDDQAGWTRQWRCPGCNLPQEAYPSSYHCWCEKEEEPKNIPGLPPHSCGQTCGRQRKLPKPCPHPCDMTCHAGPCPPCTNMGPSQHCFCGREETSRRCVETSYDKGWSCGRPCEDTMPCGQHSCTRPCHEGLCGSCTVEVEARCYCGRVEQRLSCDQLGDKHQGYSWTGMFDCHQPCQRQFDCGKHKCEKFCHPQDEQSSPCPRRPESVHHCPCGKTPLTALLEAPRTSCTDPIPNCQDACGKRLACGHHCQSTCHPGDCPPCDQSFSVACRCGRNENQVVCHQQREEAMLCQRTCRAHMNCGRHHECGTMCCPGEKRAADRVASKKKMKNISLALAQRLVNDIEPEHICTRICGRPLKCQNHSCQDLCHKGPCNSCVEAVFEDLSCSCGRTVLQAPLPCGTQPPRCTFPCERGKDCGHPQTSHNCHPDREACPPCPFLTDKLCSCGKKRLKNQPCWRSEVSCGLICGRRLRCGSHHCRKSCHRTGECEDATSPCQQPCGKAKKSCGHPCEKPCHAPFACKEDKACPFTILVTCPCQRRKDEVRCNSRAAAAAAAPHAQPASEALKCDEECARLERNRNLATALHIPDDHVDDHVPYSTATLRMYLEDIKWTHAQEEVLRAFAADVQEKRLRFKPMKSGQRAFIHSIAEDFGFDSDSLDPEPHRHVVLLKTPKFVAAPMKTLQQAARIKRAALNVGAPVNSVTTTTHIPDRPEDRSHNMSASQRWNAIVLLQPRFGMTMVELQPRILQACPTATFDFYFLTHADQVLLVPSEATATPGASQSTTSFLEDVAPRISEQVTTHGLAKSTTLGLFKITTASEPRMLSLQQGSRQASATVTADGWSQVVAKGSTPAKVPEIPSVGQKSVYTVLGSKLAEAKKKKEGKKVEAAEKAQVPAEVPNDWQDEADKEEASGGMVESVHRAGSGGGRGSSTHRRWI